MKSKFFNIKKMISFISLMIIFLCLSSFTTADVTIKHSGKANAIVSYVSSENYNSFKEDIENRIYQHNMSSGYSDAITIKSIKQNNEGYDVSYKLRRVDKVVLNGKISLDKFKNMTRYESESYYTLLKFNKGDVSCNAPVYFDNILGKVVISRDTRFKVPTYDVNNNEVDINDFIEKGNNSKDNSMMLMFQLFNFENVKKISLTLPGKITYYGGNSISVINENTIEITPSSIKAKLTKNKVVIEDGVEKIEPVVETKVINSFIGYLTYDKGISPTKIVLFSILSTIGVSFIIFTIIRIYKIGLKEIKKKEESNNE